MCSNKILIQKKLVINLGKQQTSIPNLKFQSRMSNLKSNQVKMSSFVLSLTKRWKIKSLSKNSLCNSQPVKHSLPKPKMIKINLKKMEAHLVTISWLKLQSNKQNLLNSLKKRFHKKFTLKEQISLRAIKLSLNKLNLNLSKSPRSRNRLNKPHPSMRMLK